MSASTDKDVLPKNVSNSSETNSTVNEKLDDAIDDKNMVASITNDLVQILALSDNEKEDEIIRNLFERGRQSLIVYYDDLGLDIYQAAMSGNDNALMQLLKRYFEHQWKIHNSSQKWFILFLNEYKNGENNSWYEQVLTRTARYGNKFNRNCVVLSVVLQLFFEGIDDVCVNETNVFNELWLTITQNGLKSISQYSDYIIEDVMNQLINKDQPVLFQALRKCCRGDLFGLLEGCVIVDKQNLYELALDNVAEHGWKIGLQAIQKKITPKHYKLLLEKVNVYLQQQQEYESSEKQGKGESFVLMGDLFQLIVNQCLLLF